MPKTIKQDIEISLEGISDSTYEYAQLINEFLIDKFPVLEGDIIRALVLSIFFIGFFYLIWFFSKNIILSIVDKIAARSKTTFDDHLVKRKVFRTLAHLIPILFMDSFVNITFLYFENIRLTMLHLNNLLIFIVLMFASVRAIKAFGDTLKDNPILRDKPIQSWVQLANIIVGIIFSIFIISNLIGENPSFLLTSLGAMSAVIILVFKDSILGFVGSIQLATNDMIRIGDWVTMKKHNADGDVIGITLSSVTIQNFDNTISSVPTYSFISDSFINWRGMKDSGGRRIKRHINLKIESVQFCTDDLLYKLSKVDYLKQYITQKQAEIKTYNANQNNASDLNLRQLTNVGLLREYIQNYLQQNSHINTDLTLMVRQLQPNEKGLPLEVYCFTKTKEWVVYENVISDIFDHILAILPFFDLEFFEYPTGSDLSSLK